MGALWLLFHEDFKSCSELKKKLELHQIVICGLQKAGNATNRADNVKINPVVSQRRSAPNSETKHKQLKVLEVCCS